MNESVKEFASKQFNEGRKDVAFIYKGRSIVDPWKDPLGFTDLTDEEAVSLYGLANVANFVRQVETMQTKEPEKEENTIKALYVTYRCGFSERNGSHVDVISSKAPMFKIRFEDGVETDADEDELTFM